MEVERTDIVNEELARTMAEYSGECAVASVAEQESLCPGDKESGQSFVQQQLHIPR